MGELPNLPSKQWEPTKLLTEETLKRVEEEKQFKSLPGRPPEENQSIINKRKTQKYRIRQTIIKEIEQLTRLIRTLPEDQLDQVFTYENLNLFFKGLFRKDFLPPPKPEESKESVGIPRPGSRQERLLQICDGLIDELNSYRLAYELAPELYKVLAHEDKTFAGIKAIYHQAIAEDQKRIREDREKRKKAEVKKKE